MTPTAGREHPAAVLRIYLGEKDKHGLKPLYEAVVLEARAFGLAGATVTVGAMGFGADSRLHRAHLLGLSPDLPVMVEIVDEEERLRAFLPKLESLMQGGGLVTLGPVTVLRQGNAG